MTVRAFWLALVFTSGSFATAMPNLDGIYTCNNAGEESKISVRTAGNKVFVEGLDAGASVVNKGIPCENGSNSGKVQDIGIRTASLCDDQSIGIFVSMIQPSTKTDFLVSVKLTRVSELRLNVAIALAGQMNGEAHNSDLKVTCIK